MQMEHTQLQRLNMNLSHSLQIQMRHRDVYVYMCLVEEDGGVLVEAHERYNEDTIVLLSVFTLQNEQLEPSW